MSDWRKPSDPDLFFRGRDGDPRLGEWVRSCDKLERNSLHREIFVLFGSCDDAGVAANRGRIGAAKGPDAIRKHLYKMTPPFDLAWETLIGLLDFGNVQPGESISGTHDRARETAEAVATSGYGLIALGGGHDFAAPHFLGFASGRQRFLQRKETYGLLNVDPHLDVREPENGAWHSGTPFRRILESGEIKADRLIQFGARRNRNSRDHLAFCRSRGVIVDPLETIRESGEGLLACFRRRLSELAERSTCVGLTIDMDACSDVEGTSAAPVIGLSAAEIVSLAEMAGREPKVRFLEIAEVAPPLDPTERAARVAAEAVYAFLHARAGLMEKRA